VIHYTVSTATQGHYFDICCTIAYPDPEGQQLSLPAWIPGSYMIRDFSKNILSVTATSAGREVILVKLDKQLWRAMPCSGPLQIEYRVYAKDLSVRTAYLDEQHGFFNGTSLFLSVDGQEQQPHQLTLIQAASNPDWSVATTLPPQQTDENGWGLYQCQNYDALIDHPVEMGPFEWVNFEVYGVPHAIVLTGGKQVDTQRLVKDLTKICRHHTRFFGDSEPPVDQYLFLTTVVEQSYGGLEHRDCCALICAPEDLPRIGEVEVSDGYRKFLGLCSHEYFHLWNIKRIRPESFTPYQLDEESYTRQLWAFEGITSYYDDLALVQCGIIPEESYLELLGQTLTRLQRSRGQLVQSVTDSSLDAWTKFYKQDENANNAVISYYVKGAVIALMVDLYLREKSHGDISLRMVMQLLWEVYGKTQCGVPETTIEQLCHQVADCEIPFLDDALYATKPLELGPILEKVGIRYRLRPTTSNRDSGGCWIEKQPISWLGLLYKEQTNSIKVTHVSDNSPAQQAHIATGDHIIALNQLQAKPERVQSILNQQLPGSELHLHLFRRGELLEKTVILATPPEDTVVLEKVDQPSSTQTTLQQQWLGSF
jgi:predicted metalloprotease with PDZ domain